MSRYYQSPEVAAQISRSNTPFVESPTLTDQRKRYKEYIRTSASVLLDDRRILPRIEGPPLTPEGFSLEFQAINVQYNLNMMYLLQYKNCGHCLHPVIGSPEEVECREIALNLGTPDTFMWLPMQYGCPFCRKCMRQSPSSEASLPPIQYYRMIEASNLRKRARLLGSNWAGAPGDPFLVSHLIRSGLSRGYLMVYDAYCRFAYVDRVCLDFVRFVEIITDQKTLKQVVDEYNDQNQDHPSRMVRCEDFHDPVSSLA